MSRILVVNASANGDAGRSAFLARHYVDAVPAGTGNAEMRMLATDPPPPLNPDFVAGAFAPPDQRTDAMRRALAYSDAQIAALKRAECLVIATPMYNFGMPGLLKSWFDQIIRPHDTFAMTGDPQRPYRGLLAVHQCIVITTRGSHAFAPNGPASEWNLLDRHVSAILGLIGVDNIEFVDCPGLDETADGGREQLAIAQERLCSLARSLRI